MKIVEGSSDAGVSCSAQGGFPEPVVELFFGHLVPVVAGELEESGQGLVVRFVVGGGFAVPGADFLADVASEEAVLEEGGECGVLVAAKFDGLVGDAAAGVDDAWGDDGAGRAGVDAAGAGAAAVGSWREGILSVELFRRHEVSVIPQIIQGRHLVRGQLITLFSGTIPDISARGDDSLNARRNIS